MKKVLMFIFLSTASIVTYSQTIKNAKSKTVSKSPAVYNFAKHSDFKVFLADAQKAIKNNDKDALAKMFDYPFNDYYDNPNKPNKNFIGDGSDGYKTCNSTNDFYKKFDIIFTPEVKTSILKSKYRGKTKKQQIADGPDAADTINVGEYVFEVEDSEATFNAGLSNRSNIIVAKINGIYKFVRIAFYS